MLCKACDEQETDSLVHAIKYYFRLPLNVNLGKVFRGGLQQHLVINATAFAEKARLSYRETTDLLTLEQNIPIK